MSRQAHLFRLLKRPAIRASGATAVLLLAIGGAVWFGGTRSAPANDPAVLAARIMETCSEAEHRPTCYDREIPQLMDEGVSLEASFEIVKAIQAKDDSYWFCHVVAHEISEKEQERNPDAWKEVMNRCPLNMCSNGCLHGAVQKHFSSEALNKTQIEELMPDLMDLCEERSGRKPAPGDTSSCYHELGHLSLYLSGAKPEGAKLICDEVAVRPDGRNYLQTCYEGIFMQVFEPRDPDDFALIHGIIPYPERLKACEHVPYGVQKGACWKVGWGEDAGKYCDSFDGELRNACWREAWVITSDRIQSAEGITSYCAYASDARERLKCFNKMIYSVMAMYDFDHERVLPICPRLPEDMRGECYASIVGRMLETEKELVPKALAICERASVQGLGGICYDRIAYEATHIFRPGSPESLALCRLVPAPWNTACLAPGE